MDMLLRDLPDSIERQFKKSVSPKHPWRHNDYGPMTNLEKKIFVLLSFRNVPQSREHIANFTQVSPNKSSIKNILDGLCQKGVLARYRKPKDDTYYYALSDMPVSASYSRDKNVTRKVISAFDRATKNPSPALVSVPYIPKNVKDREAIIQQWKAGNKEGFQQAVYCRKGTIETGRYVYVIGSENKKIEQNTVDDGIDYTPHSNTPMMLVPR